MGNLAIFWPMVAQAFLTFAAYFVLLSRRRTAVRGGGASLDTFRTAGTEPADSASASRNVANQFELPVLFHAVCLALYVTNGASWLAVALAWIFVVCRLVHAFVHLGSNAVAQRFQAFVAGFVVLFVLWILFALHLLGVA
ncbi:hypothetical protein F6X38_21285 [Aureimonas leprariae]|uniref:MAPEG family protein n=1 Tax=Plantimonas leprariae TaxID=2615207 RepID=A0A7V7PKN1_9HYPH|nr:MAPEG family protein [Aureimonas leprariae]KAB0676455.1 hypothetical protein F6X38_21285 [Aureimonas leprariae]